MYFQIKSQFTKVFLITFPIAFASAMYWLKTNHLETYLEIGLEDHIIEYSQFFFFLFGGILAFLTAFNFRKKVKSLFIIFLLVSFALIFIAGEEISWGERLFNIQAPEIFDGQTNIPFLKHNVQGEMNIHNFQPINDAVGLLYLMIGAYFIFAWIFFRTTEKFIKIKEDVKKYLPFIIPPPILSLYFVSTGLNLLDREALNIHPQDYEMVEFLFSLGLLIFVTMCFLESKKSTHL